MHKSYFSTIRNISLTHSMLILQDYTGIAFTFFDKNKRDIQLYGQYNGPITLFEKFYEPDLYAAYQTQMVNPLNFRIGYGYLNPSNLLMAKKVN